MAARSRAATFRWDTQITLYEKMMESVDGYERVLNRTYWADDAGSIAL